LMAHCHFLISVEGAQIGLPEVTLPVIPGMEGCHWLLRKADTLDHRKILEMILSGKARAAEETVGWMTDAAGTMQESLETAWNVATGGEHGLKRRELEKGSFEVPADMSGLEESDSPLVEMARRSIMECVQAACGASLEQALEIQARHSAGFMLTKACQRGAVGSSARKTLKI